MIKLSNGHELEWMTASGALAWDCKGWWLVQRPLVHLGIVKPELTLNVIKTLSLDPIVGNYVWWHPWTCIRFIHGGTVNKVGLTNPGAKYWRDNIAPKIDWEKYKVVASVYGNETELMKIVQMLDRLPIVAFELNDSCPNIVGHAMPAVEVAVRRIEAIKSVTRKPVIYKASVSQSYLTIAEAIKGRAEAIAINSVPYEIVFPGKRSPLWSLQKKVGGNGGGVSGRPAQKENWKAVRELIKQGALPVIAPSAMNEMDVRFLKEELGAQAIAFGVMNTKTPWRPTRIVQKAMKEKGKI